MPTVHNCDPVGHRLGEHARERDSVDGLVEQDFDQLRDLDDSPSQDENIPEKFTEGLGMKTEVLA